MEPSWESYPLAICRAESSKARGTGFSCGKTAPVNLLSGHISSLRAEGMRKLRPTPCKTAGIINGAGQPAEGWKTCGEEADQGLLEW